MPYATGSLLPSAIRAREKFDEGVVIGTAESVVRVLDRRGVELTPAAREYIGECRNLDLAKIWLDEAVIAATYTDLTYLAIF